MVLVSLCNLLAYFWYTLIEWPVAYILSLSLSDLSMDKQVGIKTALFHLTT